MFKTFKRSMSNRLIWVTSVIFLLTTLLIGTAMLKFIYEETLSHRLLETSIKAESISKDVKYIFENAKMVTGQLALHPEIKNYLKYATTRERVFDNPYYDDTLNTLIQTKASSPTFFLAWVANEKANFYLDSTGTIPDESYRIKSRPWYIVAEKAYEPSFTDPYVEWGTGRIVISSIMALREDNLTYGFVVMDIVLENIPEIFRKNQIHTTDKHFLISAQGDYVYHEDTTKVMKSKITDPADPLNPYLDFIMQDNLAPISITYEGKSYFLDVYHVDENGWKVVSLIDESSITKEIQGILLLIIGLMLIVTTLTLVLIYWRINRTMAPYQEVLTFADDIAMGKISKNIPVNFMNREDEIGALSRSFQIIIDVIRNENVILEQRIREKNRELEKQYAFILEAEKAASLGYLVAGVAHEINTPVGVSLTTASYLSKVNEDYRRKLMEGSMNKDHLKDLMAILDESTKLLDTNLMRAAELVKNFKRLAVDQSSGILTDFDLKENLEAVIVSLLHEYKNTDIRLSYDCPIGLTVHSYPGALSQVLTNLIMNSLVHGYDTGMAGKIELSASQVGQMICLTYTDDGKGLSKETLKRIYEPFYTTNRQKGSSGLGMHIVMSLVTQKLKGTIECESDLDAGVRFTLNFPISIDG